MTCFTRVNTQPFLTFFFGAMDPVLICLILSACSNPPPKHPSNICKIFRQYPSWFWATKDVAKKWHVPIYVQMAIIYEESSFKAEAKPPHKKLFGKIPWFRPTSSAGYTQATNETWRLYVKDNHLRSANRAHFVSAVNFVGWCGSVLHRKLGVPLKNARSLYLAYHEGVDGYRTQTYLRQPWLLKVANKVQRRADLYRKQLMYCQKRLPQGPWWKVLLSKIVKMH